MDSKTNYPIKEKKERSSNFELLRIICILLIIAYHYCVHGNHNTIFKSELTTNQVIAMIFGSWGLLGVNCFVFISAYFLTGSQRFSSKKLLKLLLQTSFYSIVFALFLEYSGMTHISAKHMYESVFSPLYNLYWFVTAYCILYIIHPFLNRIIDGIQPYLLARFLVVLTVLVPVYRVFISEAPIDAFLLFIYLYLIMGYLKQKPGNWFEMHAKSGFLITSSIIVLSNVISSAYGTYYHLEYYLKHAARFATRYSPLMILDAIFLFYIFKNIHIKSSKIINTLAGTTLGIYLFHEYPFARKIFWDKVFRIKEVYYDNSFILYLLASVIIIYIIGVIIDLFRLYLIEKPLFSIKIKSVERLFTRIDNYINGNTNS